MSAARKETSSTCGVGAAPSGRGLYLRALGLTLALSALIACGPPPRPIDLPPPVEATSVGVGDLFEVRIVGEDKLPTIFTVNSDGTADLPYIKRITVGGLEPQEIAELIRNKLIEKDILTDPNVSVNIKEYNSKRIEILGEVARPGSFPMQPGMTLLRAITLAGGFNSLANKSKVTVRRKVATGTRAATVSVEDIIDNRIPDPFLQAGDSVNVAQRLF